METLYFKAIVQKTAEGKSILVAVIPDDMLGNDLPSIFQVQMIRTPPTIYTGIYPTLRVNSDTIEDVTEEFKGHGIAGIITEALWYNKTTHSEDTFGISLK